MGKKEGSRSAGGQSPAQPGKVLTLPSVQDGCLVLLWSRCLRLVLGVGVSTPLLFTSLTYLWALISKGLSCVPTLPSGPITACS